MFNIKEHDFGLISPFILINSIELFAEVFLEYVFWVLNGWHFVCRYGIYWTRLDADRVIFVRVYTLNSHIVLERFCERVTGVRD